MKPPRFSYHDPATVDEALELLARHGDAARILAGAAAADLDIERSESAEHPRVW